MEGKRIESIEGAREFLTAGKAFFTIVSTKTNKRYTFRVNQLRDSDKKMSEQDKNAPFFVSFLNGYDNNSSYTFLGTIFNKNRFVYSNKSKVKFDSVINKTFMWLFNTITKDKKENFKLIEFWHEGKCGACGRKLTTPESINDGIGPVCKSIR